MSSARALLILLSLLLVAPGCRRRTTVISAGDTSSESQWSRGVWLYGQHCAGCHGDNGEGDEETPPIAGEGSLPKESTTEDGSREISFENAADVFKYVSTSMPPMDPGQLSQDDYWAIMNYMLKQAEIKAPDDLNAENAASVKLR